MSDLIFVDTNVLIYARDRINVVKRERARLWLAELAGRRSARVNLQVLNELTRWLLAKTRPGQEVDDIRSEIESLRKWGDKPLDEDEVEAAWDIRQALGYQWFDCLVVAAAEQSGCRFFLTEDMADRATYRSMTLINPFRTLPSDVLPQH